MKEHANGFFLFAQSRFCSSLLLFLLAIETRILCFNTLETIHRVGLGCGKGSIYSCLDES